MSRESEATPQRVAPAFFTENSELLRRWDAGEPVWTIEMGGMGPGYEQAIQVTVFEILRVLLREKFDSSLWQDSAVWEADRKKIDEATMPAIAGLGISGAQWGAAVSLATSFYMRGPAVVDTVKQSRRIMASNDFPRIAALAKAAGGQS